MNSKRSSSLARIMIRPPTRPSEGAQTLRQSLGTLCRLTRLDPVPRQYRMVINWGNPHPISFKREGVRVLNKPDSIRNAINKLTTFQLLSAAGVRVPLFQTELDGNRDGLWLARTNLVGSGGDGIVAIRRGDTVPPAGLYVQYIPKTVEYRVHVVNGRVIFVQQKKRRNNTEQTKDQKLIRNYDNGWVFCPVDEPWQEDMCNAAITSITGLGLDFGAVDLIRGRDDNLCYTLEVNTAPGLSSPGLIQSYTSAFKEVCDG